MRLSTVCAAALILLAAACGSAETPGVATAGNTPSASTAASQGSAETNERDAHLAFAACMRENGVPMEDPEFGPGGGVSIKIDGSGVGKDVVDAAEDTCRKLLPSGGAMAKPNPEQLAEMREMSRCMRENGVPNFPDPSPDGGIQLTPETGVNPSDPAFKAAEAKCGPKGPDVKTETREDE
ncbi:hypothetical protein LO762_29410 [Actinocorallia sp. API 0066]|uniref:hypothetical protein n=1 Tax=Actinocorallia sp. API 0066 TaxID=2896846 RepID=UPI001E2E8DB5|nr:hypothetical protein [Actinocorallia sp. API 0066]MCD0453269.1 hypothetical protein [Actinocorallia sp. API 0066]